MKPGGYEQIGFLQKINNPKRMNRDGQLGVKKMTFRNISSQPFPEGPGYTPVVFKIPRTPGLGEEDDGAPARSGIFPTELGQSR